MHARALGTLLALVGITFLACGETKGPQESDGSETHFLSACEDDDCGPGAACVCGACSKSCGEDAACAELGESATCVALAPRVAEGRCESTERLAMCDVGCIVADDCAALGEEYRCDLGFCRSGDPTPTDLGPESCVGEKLVGRDVVVIGDVLIELSVFTADVEQAAISAGALADGDHFRSYASSLTSILATGPFAIETQWTTAKGEGAARVVIMDGGATDMLNLPCGADPAPDCPALLAAVAGAERLLAELAAASVEDVVYFFYADPPANPELKASLDALRPLIENACGKSQVACHFIDLRAPFQGHPEYLNADVVFLEPGAAVAATEVWRVMQDRCVGR